MRSAHHLERGPRDASPQDPRAALHALRDTARQASARQQQEQARQAAANRLSDAARFAAMAVGGPLLSKRQGSGKAAVLVRLDWPGVLRVFDPLTGRELARSEPGAPDQLAADFDPLAYLTARS